MNDQSIRNALRLHQAGNLAEAARLYDEILRANPRHFQALYLRGFVHLQDNQFADAERMIGSAIALDPSSPDAHYNRGCALQKLSRNEEAVMCFDRAIVLKPDFVQALFNRGTSLLHLRSYRDSLSSFDAVLRLSPRDAEAWYNHGSALQGLRRFAQAGASFENALALAPDLDFARGKLLYSRLQCCDWRWFEADKSAIIEGIRAGRCVAAPLENLLISSSPLDQLQCARVWMTKEHLETAASWQGAPYRHRRIRVAYISADFRDHAAAHQIAGVIEAHDRTRFETMAMSFGPDDGSETRRRLETAFGRFVDIRATSDADAAAMLRQWEADIAVDLTGHTLDGRPGILGLRPAPLQVNFLGYPGTLGVDFVDYIIADVCVLPENERAFYSEKVVYLPDSFMPTDRRAASQAPTRADAGLPEGRFVFCSFNNIAKLSPNVFALWMRLLRNVEGSVLWLTEPGADAMANLRREANAQSVAPERLLFAPYLASAAAHLARLPLADLFLDTLPYNAHSTASDALWMGLPVLTCAGTTFAGRVAASLLKAGGMPELVTASLEEYEKLGLRLAQDKDALGILRARLARNKDAEALFDTQRFTRHLEAAYTAMVERRERGEPPTHFSVARMG